MKKVFYFSMIAVISMFVMSACSPQGPGDAMNLYGKYLVNGDYEKLAEGFAYDEDLTPEELKERKDGVAALMKEKCNYEIEQGGGFKSIVVTSEEISEDGNSAIVKFTQTYKNGESSEGDQKMVKRNGKWLMTMEK